MLRAFVSTCALAALVCGLSVPTAAYTFDRTTRFTFSQPIAIPGVTLPAGTYTFRLADPTTGRRVVQVLNDSGTQSYAMFLSMPSLRADVPNEPEISFMETGAGMPAAVKTWWQEGSTLGYEFLYPKEQALKLARGVRPAPAFAEERFSAVAGSEIAVESSSSADPVEPTVEGRVDAYGSAGAAEQQGQAGQQGQLAQSAPVTAQESTPTPADQGAREQLPRTASFIPLAVMLGTLMLFGGVWLRRKANV